MRQVAPIEASWLGEVVPHFWKNDDVEKTRGGTGEEDAQGAGHYGEELG